MKKLFYFLLIFTLSCSSSTNILSNESILFKVDFQDFFINDTINLKLNDCPIVSGIILNSDNSLGVSNFRLAVYNKADNNYRVTFSEKNIVCKGAGSNIWLNIELNGNLNKFKIDLKQGMYIGFSKKNKTSLSFFQSKKPFEYN